MYYLTDLFQLSDMAARANIHKKRAYLLLLTELEVIANRTMIFIYFFHFPPFLKVHGNLSNILFLS